MDLIGNWEFEREEKKRKWVSERERERERVRGGGGGGGTMFKEMGVLMGMAWWYSFWFFLLYPGLLWLQRSRGSSSGSRAAKVFAKNNGIGGVELDLIGRNRVSYLYQWAVWRQSVREIEFRSYYLLPFLFPFLTPLYPVDMVRFLSALNVGEHGSSFQWNGSFFLFEYFKTFGMISPFFII